MGLILNFDVCQETPATCSTLKFSETTGEYDPANTGGYNPLVPADDAGNATAATLYITQPDGTVITIDMLAEGFPTIDSNVSYDITTYTLGLTASNALTAIPDGVYKFEYRVTINAGGTVYVYREIKYVVVVCQINCAINSLAASLSLCNCNCKDDGAWADFLYYKAVQHAICTIKNCEQNKTKIQEYIDHLKSMLALADTDCGCIDSSNSNKVKTINY